MRTVTQSDKLCAVGEIGTIPDVPALTEHGIPWCWFMTWSHDFGGSDRFTSQEELRRAYSCENAVTLDRLPEIYHFE